MIKVSCQECDQEFDLSKADEANNFYHGHDCEPKPKSTDEMRCPCCKAPSPRGSKIAWCDMCNTDSGPCCQEAIDPEWTDEDYEQERADLLYKGRIEDAD